MEKCSLEGKLEAATACADTLRREQELLAVQLEEVVQLTEGQGARGRGLHCSHHHCRELHSHCTSAVLRRSW
jgi:hypothetical protein